MAVIHDFSAVLNSHFNAAAGDDAEYMEKVSLVGNAVSPNSFDALTIVGMNQGEPARSKELTLLTGEQSFRKVVRKDAVAEAVELQNRSVDE